ncbi:hypothetical protein PFISCL1PPCAC_4906, partial [Pristionchus fissidentatus]
LSFLHEDKVYHCRIKSKMIEGVRKYYFVEKVVFETLYELISHHMKVRLVTPLFSTRFVIPCPQPKDYLNQPWFSPTATKEIADEMLSKVPHDGAFLIRYSDEDKSTFVLSVRLEGVPIHFRLHRNGRIFHFNQVYFENLNQIVEYYAKRDFLIETRLKFPVRSLS